MSSHVELKFETQRIALDIFINLLAGLNLKHS